MIIELFIFILQVIKAIIGIASIIAALLTQCCPALVNPNQPLKPKSILLFAKESNLFMGLAILGWALVYYNGVYASLWFVPEAWGQFNDGQWSSFRSTASAVFSALMVIITFYNLTKISSGKI